MLVGKHFEVVKTEEHIAVKPRSPAMFVRFHVYADGRYVGTKQIEPNNVAGGNAAPIARQDPYPRPAADKSEPGAYPEWAADRSAQDIDPCLDEDRSAHNTYPRPAADQRGQETDRGCWEHGDTEFRFSHRSQRYSPPIRLLTIIGFDRSHLETVERISLVRSQNRSYEGTYRAGDIFTACDNVLPVIAGYLGHAALVVDEQHMIEAVINVPYIRVSRIEDFVRSHPRHAVYRPISQEMGEKAAQFAIQYYQESEKNRLNGMVMPKFSFSEHIPLEDPWSSVYCSKLIWLSYYYGAGYKFENDFYLFSPEDIDDLCSRDPNFECIYKHPKFQFLIDT